MPTFKVQQEEIQQKIVTIHGEDAHHFKVLRVKRGERVRLTDGGRLFQGEVIDTSNQVRVQILGELPAPSLPQPIHLFLSLLKREKMEFLVEKAVELNIEAVHFVCSKRSVRTSLSENKKVRLEKIAQSAQTQCGRLIPLKISMPRQFSDVVCSDPSRAHLFCHHGEGSLGLRQFFSSNAIPPPYGIWIGPEGGWAESEVELAIKNNFHFVCLGDLTLRSETAALHAVSMVLGYMTC